MDLPVWCWQLGSGSERFEKIGKFFTCRDAWDLIRKKKQLTKE